MMLGALVSLGLLSMKVAAYQQRPVAPMVVELEEVRANLYMGKGGGGNSAVFVGSDGVTVVDTKNPGWGTPLLEKIRSVTDKPIVRIINTHTHGDHVSGNVDFPATVDIVAQENTAANMKEMRPRTGVAATPGPNIFQRNEGRGLPKRTFKDTMTIGTGADQIDLYYFGRAHTGGDAFVVFPALRAMHSGDAFHTRDLPIMDTNNGGSGVEYSATLAKAAAALTNVDVIINGHNPATTTIADMKIQSEFIAEFVKFVQDAKRAGRTVDDVVATWATPAKYVGYAAANAERVAADAQVIWDETM
jgi:glyoxylase-like metal-dependent hydrolase (beta-lactamase superfamily II)